MTTAQIESYADPGNQLATADINLLVLLRRKVIPDFYETVGYPFWRRKRLSKAVLAAATYFDVTDQNIGHVRQVYLSPDTDSPLNYIGDREDLVQLARVTTTADKPNAYWYEWEDASGAKLRFYFQAPTDAAYTVLLSYDEHIIWADDTTSVDLGTYIPVQFHWALVEMLKRELYERRFGDGDSRYQRADTEAGRLISQAMENLEGGRGSRAVFIR